MLTMKFKLKMSCGILGWVIFFLFFKYIYTYGGEKSEREGVAFGWWLWANRRLTQQHSLQVKEVK